LVVNQGMAFDEFELYKILRRNILVVFQQLNLKKKYFGSFFLAEQ